jgi:hypothetical protein
VTRFGGALDLGDANEGPEGVGPGPPPSEIVAYFEAEAAAMENAGCPGTGKPGPGD